MAKPIIVYQSMLRNTDSVVTATATETGFAVANLHDYRSFSLWKFNAVTSPINIDIDVGVGNTADAGNIAIVNSNLNTVGATVEIFAAAGTPPGVSRGGPWAVGTDNVWFQTFTNPGAFRYWRVQIVDPSPPFAAKPFIGELFLGNRMELPHFLDPSFDPFFDDVEAQSARTEGGHYAGALLRGHSHRGTISFGEAGAPRSAFTSDLNAFIDDHALLRRPFVFVLDRTDADFDTARYLKVPDTERIGRRAVGGSWQQLTFELPVEEAFMEPAT